MADKQSGTTLTSRPVSQPTSGPTSSPTSVPASGVTPAQANYALVIFLLAYILSFVDRQILSLMVDPIRRDLDISDLQMGLLQGMAFALLYAVAGVPIGLLADRLQRKRIIAAGVLFWSAATALCGLAGNYALLFAARMGVGLGEAALSPAAHSYLSDAYPRPKLARAMAVYALGITIGAGAALMIGGKVVDLIAFSGDVTLPLLGTLRPWQATFLLVASPGIVVALLVAMIREPRRASLNSTGSAPEASGILPLLAHLRRHARVFISIYLSSCALGIMGYGMSAWYPTLLIRSFGLTPGEAGWHLGLVFLVLGSAGSIGGGLLAERMALRGRFDANLRVVALTTLAVAVPAICAPLMPSALLVVLMFAPACFFFHAYFGCSVAALQLATPNRMRATNAALFLLANSLVGLSIGTAVVPLINAVLFDGMSDLGPSLAVVAAFSTVTGAMFAFSGLKAYGKLVLDNAEAA
ncbi:MAG TPA: MFS transporter [Pedomonas sp.]|uniref:spinster family MFS transporter n=1 Tax=Pedomonas sp. TaxID=2976421 RepID=UPI002F42F3BA